VVFIDWSLIYFVKFYKLITFFFVLPDIVFCRTWYNVEVPKLYNPVTSLLLPLNEKNSWRGMKTTGQLKREQGIKGLPQNDSMYTVSIFLIFFKQIVFVMIYFKTIFLLIL